MAVTCGNSKQDENAEAELGDTVTWKQNEHCIVLMGYDDESYYFADSVAGKITA